jgi:hypothetical protein
VIGSGGSAGGCGATFNWHLFREAFPCARVDLVNDAGAPMRSPPFAVARRQLWNEAWDIAGTVPADCPECATDWSVHVA